MRLGWAVQEGIQHGKGKMAEMRRGRAVLASERLPGISSKERGLIVPRPVFRFLHECPNWSSAAPRRILQGSTGT